MNHATTYKRFVDYYEFVKYRPYFRVYHVLRRSGLRLCVFRLNEVPAFHAVFRCSTLSPLGETIVRRMRGGLTRCTYFLFLAENTGVIGM